MTQFSRRAFLLAASAASALGSLGPFSRRLKAQTGAIETHPFAKVFELAPGVWAIESTPGGGDFTTTCNGGIIAGDEGVLLLEGYNTVAGATWASDLAERLVGRPPTHVVLTHFHADHAAGLAGYGHGADTPEILATRTTRDLLVERSTPAPPPTSDEPSASPRVPESLISQDDETTIDLGGRTVTLLPRAGHTPSDVAVRIDDPAILWCGDLLFLGLFPNYMDAIPTKLRDSCFELLRDERTVFVPGHGPITDHAGVQPYLDLIELLEKLARDGLSTGRTIEQIAANFEIPESLGEWPLFREGLVEDALSAWEKDPDR